jgi:hypothetical protein
MKRRVARGVAVPKAPLGRSEVMSRVRGRDTKPEMRVRRVLHRAGLRYRTDVRSLPGRPDIVFASPTTVEIAVCQISCSVIITETRQTTEILGTPGRFRLCPMQTRTLQRIRSNFHRVAFALDRDPAWI